VVVDFPARFGKGCGFGGTEFFRRRLACERDLVRVSDQTAFNDQARTGEALARQHYAWTEREPADHAIGLAHDARPNLEIRIADANHVAGLEPEADEQRIFHDNAAGLDAIERGWKRHQRIEHHLPEQRIQRIDRFDLDQRAALRVLNIGRHAAHAGERGNAPVARHEGLPPSRPQARIGAPSGCRRRATSGPFPKVPVRKRLSE
jgi:hypothetical protein